MKRARFNSLYLAILLSVVLHLALFRLIRMKETPEMPLPETYEVTLLYYVPAPPEVVKPYPAPAKRKKSVKKPDEIREEPPVEEEPVVEEQDRAEVRVEEHVEEEEVARGEDREVQAEKSDFFEAVSEMAREESGAEHSEADKGRAIDYSAVLEGLRSRILSEKAYPAVARKRGMEGIVHLMVSLDPEGELIEVKVIRSSGHRVLDRAAIVLIRRVVPYEHGLGQSLTIEIPIRYSLVD